MLSTFTVTNANDSGAGSLRQAIESSNATSGTFNSIDFDIPGSGVQTIEPLSALPALTQPVTIDGTTEPGYNGQPLIQIDGTEAGSGVVGIEVASSASGSAIRGLSITDFSGGGVQVNGASNVAIVNDDIGLVQLSTGVVVQGNGVFGVELENGATDDGLADDVVSGQMGNGVDIVGSGTMDNLVMSSEIGTDPTGMTGVDSAGNSLANTQSGVAIAAGASDNTLYGDVISNNDSYGVYIDGSGTMGNMVEGSMIGTNSMGTAALPNYVGVIVQDGASGNMIGGVTPELAPSGTVVLGTTGSSGTQVGGTTNAPATQIPGTTNAPATQIPGTTNAPATQIPGTTNAPATQISGTTNAPATQIPGTTNAMGQTMMPSPADGLRNVISGNNWDGVELAYGATDNMVEGNYVGVSANGTSALPNEASGVSIYEGAYDNTVGGTAAGSGNVISGNAAYGVYMSNYGTDGNVVEGNFIGTDYTGMYAVPNYVGVLVQNDASDNTIGGVTTAGTPSNVISGNNWDGVEIITDATGNMVEGDYIGVNASGSSALPNKASGVSLYDGSQDNTIGGSVAGSGNVLSGNVFNGVYIGTGDTSGNMIEGNDIGTDWTGSYAVPNSVGVMITNGATQNTIGGTATFIGGSLAGAGNVIAGNTSDGVQIEGSGTDSNVVEGDFIGLTATGTSGAGNWGNGVSVFGGASDNTIGGTAVGTANVISANGGDGVYISDAGTSGNVVEGNLIGTDPTGLYAAGNGGDGVIVQNGATGNTIGGTAPGTGNIISANGGDGVLVTGAGTDNNVIEGNMIGLSADMATLYDGGYDIEIDPGASDNTAADNELPSWALTLGVPTQSTTGTPTQSSLAPPATHT